MTETAPEALEARAREIGMPIDTFVQGKALEKPLNYWEYVNLDALLSLQQPRTEFPDEKVFIMYHQVTELFLGLARHELEQICQKPDLDAGFMREHLNRVNRYIGLCVQSFDVMRDCMSAEQYNTFRLALAPASGFQSVQFRLLELMATDPENLVMKHGQTSVDISNPDSVFDHFYWQQAGINRKTGERSLMLKQFLERYEVQLKTAMTQYKHSNLWQRFRQLNAYNDLELVEALRNLDRQFNIAWPLVHLKTAEHYLGDKAATGGSPWRKYLHPSFQRRIFFPELWSAEELEHWGQEYILEPVSKDS